MHAAPAAAALAALLLLACAAPGAAQPASLAGSYSRQSVLQYHSTPSHNGSYFDATFSPASVRLAQRVQSFNVSLPGPTYAQPLYVVNGVNGRETVYVASTSNVVSAIDATTGNTLWRKNLSTPVQSADLDCGNVFPIGVLGTPAINETSRTLFLDALGKLGNGSVRHLVYALALDDGSTRPGYPLDLEPTLRAQGVPFSSQYANQRGGLTLLNNVLYIPFGGFAGDCGDYRGFVAAVPADQPSAAGAFFTRGLKGGAWAPGGAATDGTSVFVATGNTDGAEVWSGGEAAIRLQPGAPGQLNFTNATRDFFVPANWKALDDADTDIGSSGVILVDLPGATPSQLAVIMGKNGVVYLLDRNNLGGVGDSLYNDTVAGSVIINAPAAYTTSNGTFLVFQSQGNGTQCPRGQSGDLVGLRLIPGSPPSFTTAWCAPLGGRGSPMAVSANAAQAVVWAIGAEGNNRLRAYDGATGEVLFTSEQLSNVRRFQTPIAARGRVWVAADTQLYQFALPGAPALGSSAPAPAPAAAAAASAAAPLTAPAGAAAPGVATASVNGLVAG